MKSRASIKSHPLHPILVGFPIAFYIGTLIFDALAVINGDVEYAVVGKYIHIGGVISAVAAAVPGIIDYIYTVPPESSAKKRATKHGFTNSVVLILFIVALFFKYEEGFSPYILLAIEFVAVGLTFYAGWLGGTLVHRNQIGVDIRYAGAGKWKEQYIKKSSEGPFEVGKSDELKVDQMKLIHIKDKRIVVARTEQGFVAFDDRCTHRGGSLAAGAMICGTVQCPWHGTQFDVNTGEVKAGPGNEKITTYRLTEAGGTIYLDV
ncbi:MAG: hypothetical protein JWQ40_3282 [Segetibacter sp.]|jgi:nitrite reductase/ring-hydroxylating ferredoxin subunit/uncharacterized membrane protein|nr:hypothetical protein [Segetibacter sp.]